MEIGVSLVSRYGYSWWHGISSEMLFFLTRIAAAWWGKRGYWWLDVHGGIESVWTYLLVLLFRVLAKFNKMNRSKTQVLSDSFDWVWGY